MALGQGLTSVRGNRGENYENEPLVRQKHTKKTKFLQKQHKEMPHKQQKFQGAAFSGKRSY
jgi:hypothetical protein